MTYTVFHQRLDGGKPLMEPLPVLSAVSISQARSGRRAVGIVWQGRYPNRHIRDRPGRTDLLVDGVLVGYLYAEDERPAPEPHQARYAVEVRGTIVSRHWNKAEAGKRLFLEVERWRSSRWPVRRANPMGRRSSSCRQILSYWLTDRRTYAGEIRLINLRRKE